MVSRIALRDFWPYETKDGSRMRLAASSSVSGWRMENSGQDFVQFLHIYGFLVPSRRGHLTRKWLKVSGYIFLLSQPHLTFECCKPDLLALSGSGYALVN